VRPESDLSDPAPGPAGADGAGPEPAEDAPALPGGEDDPAEEALLALGEAALAEARREAESNWERYLRAEADLDNQRKLAERRREEALARQRRELFGRFLVVADNLERALAHAGADPAALLAGVETTYRDLGRLLALEGVVQVPALGEPFDPAVHEAVGVVPAPGATDERVVAVEQPGYTLGGDLLRPARVIIGRPPDEG